MARRASKSAGKGKGAAPSRGRRVLVFVALLAIGGIVAVTVPVRGRTLAHRAQAWLEPSPRPHTARAEARLPAELARTAVVLPDAHAADLIKPGEKQALDSLIRQKTERRP